MTPYSLEELLKASQAWDWEGRYGPASTRPLQSLMLHMRDRLQAVATLIADLPSAALVDVRSVRRALDGVSSLPAKRKVEGIKRKERRLTGIKPADSKEGSPISRRGNIAPR